MTYKFGTRSMERLETTSPRLQKVLHRAMQFQVMDFTIIWGYRGKDPQEEAFAAGLSKKRWPNSLHNRFPSPAVDVAPWPINWKDNLAFARLVGIIDAAASEVGEEVRWGGDWDDDGSSADQTFMDLGHIELKYP